MMCAFKLCRNTELFFCFFKKNKIKGNSNVWNTKRLGFGMGPKSGLFFILNTNHNYFMKLKNKIIEFLDNYQKNGTFIYFLTEDWKIYDILIVKNYYDLPVSIFLKISSKFDKPESEQIDFMRSIEIINGFYFMIFDLKDLIYYLDLVQQRVDNKLKISSKLELKNDQILTSG